ncbi:MAG: type IV pilin [Candidatus Bathyarchaeia archaeon]
MKNILKNRRALSTVVTTLIILVVSVLLAGVVTYFAINVVSTRVQEESLNLQYQHVWFSTTDSKAEAAIMITNTGGRDVVLQSIAVRGQTIPTADLFWFPVTTIADLKYVSQTTNISTSTLIPAAFQNAGNNLTFTATTTSITLKSGSTIAVYLCAGTTPPFAPGSVTVNDVGLTIAISVFSAQATYIKETNVNAAS